MNAQNRSAKMYAMLAGQVVFARQGERRCPRRVIFMHIPKTAGTTVTGYFKTILGSSWRGQVIGGRDGCDGLKLTLTKGARYVGGHFGADALSRFRGDAYTFTFLRDPLDRLLSAWRYGKSRPAEASRLPYGTLEEALATNCAMVRHRFDNPIARQLAFGVQENAPGSLPREQWVDAALATLASMDRVGWQETFDTDFRAVLADVGLPAPASFDRRNASETSKRHSTPCSTPPSAELECLAEPFIALDRALIERWRARDNADVAAAIHDR